MRLDTDDLFPLSIIVVFAIAIPIAFWVGFGGRQQITHDLIDILKYFAMVCVAVAPFIVWLTSACVGKYGSGTPFYGSEQLQGQLGVSLPAATQWEVVEEAAELLKPARDELIRQAAQGEVMHNDDTSMRVLRLVREPSDERTGVFTSGIVSTGRQHAARTSPTCCSSVPKTRARPFRCDALSRNVPKLAAGWRFCWQLPRPRYRAAIRFQSFSRQRRSVGPKTGH
jgi:Transposase IS66 family